MEAWFAGLRGKRGNRMILVGDLNVAPLETDVWSHKQLLKVVSHTPAEVERFLRVQAAHDWVDVMRRHVPAEEKLFTWWSYRNRDWRASNRGRRLDHIWTTPALDGAATSHARAGRSARLAAHLGPRSGHRRFRDERLIPPHPARRGRQRATLSHKGRGDGVCSAATASLAPCGRGLDRAILRRAEAPRKSHGGKGEG